MTSGKACRRTCSHATPKYRHATNSLFSATAASLRSVFSVVMTTLPTDGRQDARCPAATGQDGCATTYPMKRQITSLATVLLGIVALAVGNSAAQSDSDKAVDDLIARVLQLKIDSLSDEPLTVAQATELASPAGPQKKPDIHYVPTPQELVDVMLDMAKVGKNDIVYDLGSGDGRLVITAAKKCGASGTGIDIDPERIAEARENAKKAGVEDKVRFVEQDLFQSDFHDATVVTLYLLNELNLRLRPRIFAQIKPGARVVSHAFTMGEWEPDAQKTIEIRGESYDAYYWLVPANMSGRWKVTGNKSADVPNPVTVEQKFQKIIVRSVDGGEVLGEGNVDGATFTFAMNEDANGKSKLFQGKIEGNTIEATNTDSEEHHWKAVREPGSEKPLDPSANSPLVSPPSR
jgi:SAM-dependent methyltransferase